MSQCTVCRRERDNDAFGAKKNGSAYLTCFECRLRFRTKYINGEIVPKAKRLVEMRANINAEIAMITNTKHLEAIAKYIQGVNMN
jgi:hypothetical protein